MNVDVDMDEQMLGYMAQHFVDFETIIRRSGADKSTVEHLIAAGAAPGVIYARSDEGVWWGALGAFMGKENPTPMAGRHWYNPAIIWWLRRALLKMAGGISEPLAAQNNREVFLSEFVGLLRDIEDAALAYAPCFDGGDIVEDKARVMGEQEWRSWAQGAYAVCLRRFSARSCIKKEALRARIVAACEDKPGFSLGDEALFDKVEQLEALILPFAPWERPNGTPGKAIDAPLARLKLGVEEPYGC
jgi:Family of unknown function (DUF6058)